MSHSELQTISRLKEAEVCSWQRDLRIITDTLPSFTEQQSSGSARANAPKLDPFLSVNYPYENFDVITGSTTPYVFTPVCLLTPSDGKFKFFPTEQPIGSAKNNNLPGQTAGVPRGSTNVTTGTTDSSVQDQEIVSENIFSLTQPSLNEPQHSSALQPPYSLTNSFLDGLSSDKRAKDERLKDSIRVPNTKWRGKKKPGGASLYKDDLEKLVKSLTRREKDILLQLILQDTPSGGNVSRKGSTYCLNDTGVSSSIDDRGSNMPSMVSDVSTQNFVCTPDQADSLVNSEVCGFSNHVQDHAPRHTPLHNKYESLQSPEPASSLSPNISQFYSRGFSGHPGATDLTTETSSPDIPIMVDMKTNYIVPNTPGVHINDATPIFTPHFTSQYKSTGIGLASSMFDRRRPRQTFRATIYENSPKASKSFSEHDDNIILAAIFYYIGDYNTTDLNWHAIYYYYALLIYNNRSLSSLRSRFHKYLKLNFVFDALEHPQTYWLDMLDLCVSTLHQPTIQQNSEPYSMIPTRQSQVHYLVASIFVLLRPDMQYNELKHNFSLWLELISGPHSFL